MAIGEWSTRRLERTDREAWERLFGAYLRFYEVEPSPAHLERVWSWIHEEGELEAILALPASGVGDPVGLAHLRPFVRPARAAVGGFLDDLYVDPSARGSGAVEALFAAIEATAAERGWGTVRWITAADNHRARAAYERLAERTGWVTYELAVVGSGEDAGPR
jgi:RimJ/RimL family protein N-acetyltransferase